MNKQEALKIVLNCSKLYHSNLQSRNLRYILQDKSKNFNSFEIIFESNNFLHLTGLNILNNKIKSSKDFYKFCLRNQLSISDFEFNQNGTTPRKLEILQALMQIHKNAKIVGDYNNIKKYLYTEKLIGTVNFCLGCVIKNNYYRPNTSLDEDIRDITIKQDRVAIILRKKIKECKYNEVTYMNKKIITEDRKELKEYCNRIGIDNIF